MGDSHSSKPGSRPRNDPSPVTPTATRDKTTPGNDPNAGRAGRIVHDARGNAVWDWVKDATRVAIDSTSRLLKRLEVPELKVEDSGEQELKVESERDAGGGYDPYGSSSPPSGTVRGAKPDRNTSTKTNSTGGGYDPYGKGVTTPGRKR